MRKFLSIHSEKSFLFVLSKNQVEFLVEEIVFIIGYYNFFLGPVNIRTLKSPTQNCGDFNVKIHFSQTSGRRVGEISCKNFL